MFRSLFQISKNSFANELILFAAASVVLCLLGPIQLFEGSDVPITLQSLLIVLIPVLLGWKIGFLAVLCYLLLGGLGIPVFVGYSSGFEKFSGPTGGFLIAFALSAMVSGLIVGFEQPKSSRLKALLALITGHFIILVMGLIWLWQIIPEENKWDRIVQYFAPATVIKITISFLIVQILLRIAQKVKPSSVL